MKKWFFLFIILNSSLVLAQEVNILGQNYSIIILLPLVFILLGILFFLSIYLRDNLPNLKRVIPKKRINAKKKKKEKETFVDYRKEFDSFNSRTKKLDVNEKFNQFSGLVRDFLSHTFDAGKQSTHDELELHITKGEKIILPFSQKLEDIKYSGKEISKNELNKLIKTFELIVKRYSKKEKKELGSINKILEKFNLISLFKSVRRDLSNRAKTEYLTNKRKIFERLRILKPKTKIIVPKLKVNKKKIEIKEKEIEIKESPTIFEVIKLKSQERKLSYLIKNCNKLMNSNPGKAKELYSELIKVYYQMPIEYEEKFAHNLSDLNEGINESLKYKEEKELNQLTKRMVDTITSKEKSIVIHDKIPFFKNKVDDLIQELKLLELRGIKELRGTKKYFTNEFIEFLHRIKNLEKREIKLFKKHKEDSINKLNESVSSSKNKLIDTLVISKNKLNYILTNNMDRLSQIIINLKKLEKTEIKGFKKHKVNIMNELNNLINNLKKAEKKDVKIIRAHENSFIDGAKEVLHKIKELEHKEHLFLKKKGGRLNKAIKNLLESIKEEEKRRIVEIESKEREILDNIHQMMKSSIKVEPKLKTPKPKLLEIPEIESIESKPKIKMSKILPPKIREYDVESFERIEPKITRMPKIESKIKVEVPKSTKDFKDLDKQEKELFKKLIKVENEPNYIEHKHRVLKVTKKKDIHAPQLHVKRLRSNRKIKGLNKEEKDLYKKLIEVS